MVLTAIIALAAVGTAWAGFQSAKWSGVQANSYAEAGAARTESTRKSTQAGQQTTVDVITFTEWLAAVQDDVRDDPAKMPKGNYRPDTKVLSGILFNRFRDEFKPAVRAWLDTKPLINSGKAPPTPFAMKEYKLATATEADKLLQKAEQRSAQAREANQISDNYVLTAVLLALVLFFAALTGRARRGPSVWVLFALTVVALLVAVGLLASFPVEI
nr:hypothetical protein [Streptomyces coryli]